VAEAVLVIDAKGGVLLTNTAARNMLRYEDGMTISQIRNMSTAYHADGVTKLTAKEMPSEQVLRGEPFDEQEIVIRPGDGRAPLHLMVSGRPLRDASPHPAKPSASCSNRKSSKPSASSPAASRTISTTC
jgi:PAS domain-containing protein